MEWRTGKDAGEIVNVVNMFGQRLFALGKHVAVLVMSWMSWMCTFHAELPPTPESSSSRPTAGGVNQCSLLVSG